MEARRERTDPKVISDGLSLAEAQSEVSHDWTVTSFPALASCCYLGVFWRVPYKNIQKLRNSLEFFFFLASFEQIGKT